LPRFATESDGYNASDTRRARRLPQQAQLLERMTQIDDHASPLCGPNRPVEAKIGPCNSQQAF